MNKNELNLILLVVNIVIFMICALLLICIIGQIESSQEKLKLWATAIIFLGTVSFTAAVYFLSKQKKIR